MGAELGWPNEKVPLVLLDPLGFPSRTALPHLDHREVLVDPHVEDRHVEDRDVEDRDVREEREPLLHSDVIQGREPSEESDAVQGRQPSVDSDGVEERELSGDVSRETPAEVSGRVNEAANRAAHPNATGDEDRAVESGDVSRETRPPRRAANPESPSQLPVTDEPLPAPLRQRIIVVANQKGGVGKTTTAVNVAVALAQGGLSILLIDLDPQGNASTALGVDHHMGVPGTYEVLLRGDAISDHAVDSPESEHLRVLPATIDLAGAEIELVPVIAREQRLRKALTRFLADNPTDYVILDCPPSLGLLTVNAFVAATEILIPIQCEYYALEGLTQLLRTIDMIKGDLNDTLQLGSVLLTMYDARTRLAAQVAGEVRKHFAAETLNAVIPRSVRISEAPSYGQSVLTYDPNSAGSRAYRSAARDIAYGAPIQTQPTGQHAAAEEEIR